MRRNILNFVWRKKSNKIVEFFIKGRKAIAEAFMILLWAFTIQELDCIGALSFYNPRIRLYWCCLFDHSKPDKQVRPSEHKVS